jgi:hypothetical protein
LENLGDDDDDDDDDHPQPTNSRKRQWAGPHHGVLAQTCVVNCGPFEPQVVQCSSSVTEHKGSCDVVCACDCHRSDDRSERPARLTGLSVCNSLLDLHKYVCAMQQCSVRGGQGRDMSE